MKRRQTLAAISTAAISLVTLSSVGCSTNRERTATISIADLRVDPRLAEGQRVFMAQCNQCHVGGAGGLGPSLNDKCIPSFFIKFQVRHAPGTMPKFSENDISQAQLDDLVAYMKFLRSHPDSAI